MEISISKTKTSTVSKEPLPCKLEVQRKVIEKAMKFKHLGVEVTSDGELQSEVKRQAYKTFWISK
jgi:hypothetical protein